MSGLQQYRRLVLGVLLVLMCSCTGERVPDCFQAAGDIVTEEISLPGFDKITVFERVELILSQGDTQRIILETGEALRRDIRLEVSEGTLTIYNDNACNLFRDYGITKVYVTAPNITELRSSTGLPIRSEGVLGFENLTLYSESFLNPETETTDGTFILNLDNRSVRIVVNGIAYFQLTGRTDVLDIVIAAGDSRIEAAGLVSQEVRINHRGSNDIQVFPVSILSGVIRGTGDVESFNRPDSVSVSELYKGRLLFID